jgi:hypothetical protein
MEQGARSRELGAESENTEKTYEKKLGDRA